MANILTDTNLKCIKWTVEPPCFSGRTLLSKTFLFQKRNCFLKFYTDSRDYSYLNFKCNGELQLPIPATLRVILNSKTLAHLTTSITRAEQTVWEHTETYSVLCHRLTFELIFHADCSKEDRCIQTASYLNTNISLGCLPGDFSKLLETGTDHDVEMKCGENAIKTHKLVLSARSSVFRAMLRNDMLEGDAAVVEIQDMDVNYFQEFINYLYTDIIPELTFDKAKALYKAGDKYDIQSLMLRCAEYLQDTLSPENAFECYALADAHSDQKLKDIIKTYLLEEKVYLQNEHWLPFYNCFPEVALEVYRWSYEKNMEK